MNKTARSHLSILAAVAVIAAIVIFLVQPLYALLWWWGIWGVVTFLYYGYDKQQARNAGWRVPESILLLLPLIGGFIGGWAGMFGFRHKTQHMIFLIVMVAATVLNILFFFWFR